MHLLMDSVPSCDDGTECPVAYASQTLLAAENNYSQVEKEGLAVVYAVKKFNNYLFQVESDHQPLSCLFDSSKLILPMASARIQMWALIF